ncbi:sulfate/molybdate ABC transporter ATP-binding protein [Pusillimonas sp.]|uniref:sulfate/molybdate ABC transporter ATP-binding protein n=1 Tax=Pusillimonas sp. TaxID=3040095 RepID=UPI0029AD609D|nr:ATP-binding cassette domain-containing protein [Pusillimonas sp.]MDX3895977.1 ATP-binding cassette domain-containing protein [Pusillimonas sp.]
MIWDVDLRKRFVGRTHSFELDVQFRSDTHKLVLFGPSGAGKSLTLKMIAGLETPDDGHVRLGGASLYDRGRRVDLSPQRRGLAYVFQDYALFPHLTVVQNIAFGLHRGLANPRRTARHEAVTRWIEAFHLESVANQYPEQLSGGQRQRTALARALVAEPRALLLDEPFAALDRSLRRHLRQELSELLDQLGIPMLLITHDEEDVVSLADAVIRVHEGRAGEEQEPAALAA